MINLITNFVVNENGSTSTKAALAVAVALMATQVLAGGSMSMTCNRFTQVKC